MTNALTSNTPDALHTTDKPVLISFAICPFVQRSAILLEFKNQSYERINIDLKNKPEWFMQLSPTGKVPALVINKSNRPGDTAVIFESTIINEYLDEQYGKAVLPNNALEKAQQRAWISFSESLIFLQFKALAANDIEQANEISAQLHTELLKLKPDDNGYFSGDSFSLVDAAYAPLFTRLHFLTELYEHFKNEAATSKEANNLWNWIQNIRQQDAVIASVSDDFDAVFLEYFEQMGSAIIKSSNNA